MIIVLKYFFVYKFNLSIYILMTNSISIHNNKNDTVSYTHLDVYKRQSKCIILRNAPEAKLD